VGKSIDLAKNAEAANYVWRIIFSLRKNQIYVFVFPEKIETKG